MRFKISKEGDRKVWRVTITDKNKRARTSSSSRTSAEELVRMMKWALREGDFLRKYPKIATKLGLTSESPDWDQAVELWATHCSDINNRAASIKDINHCKLAGRRLNNPALSSLYPELISGYITNNYLNEKSRSTIRSALVMFFSYCDKQGWVDIDQLNGRKIKWDIIKSDKKPITFLSIEDCRTLIDSVLVRDHRQNSDLVRTKKFKLALGCALFLGVRPGCWVKGEGRYGELQMLRWSDWDPRLKQLTIRAEVSKNRQERVISDLPDNMLKAFNDCALYERDEYICPCNYTNWMNKLREWRGDISWCQDILRHTFGTYAYWRGLEWALDAGGWDRPATLFERYRSKRANADMSKEFFRLPL